MSMTTRLSFSQPRRSVRIGMTSLIDVIFMLLMFFMLATSFEQWRSIQLTTKVEDSSAVKKQPKLVLLQVHPEFIELNGQRVQISQIASTLQESDSSEVIVKSMGNTRLQRIVSVMDQLRAAGIDSPTLNIDQ